MGDGWRPLGDDAVTGILAHDVLSVRTPLVGMPSTIATANAVYPAHHPGPLLFWALALPDRLSGSAPVGLLLGAVLVNVLAVLAIGVVSRRVAGNGAALGALTIVVVLAWALGRQAIIDVWNPYLAVFPMLAMLVCTWAVFAGDARVMWLVALLASFVAQAHILFVPIAVAFGVAATCVVIAMFVRRARVDEPWKRDAAWVGGSTAATLLIVWSFPLFDQVTHTPGNFTNIRQSLAAQHTPTAGVGYALRIVVQSVAVLPLFARQSSSFALVGRSWSQLGPLRILSAVIVLGLLVAGTVIAFRRRDRIALAAGCTAMLALVVAAITIARLPTQPIDIVRYRLIEGWVVGAFTWFALGIVVVRAAPARVTERPGLRKAAVAVALTILVVMPIATAFSNTFDHDDPQLFTVVGNLAHDAAPHLDTRCVVQDRAAQRHRSPGHGSAIRPDTRARPTGPQRRRRERRHLPLAQPHDAAECTASRAARRQDRGRVTAGQRNAARARHARATPSDARRAATADEDVRRYLSDRHVLSVRGRDELKSGVGPLAPQLASLFDGHTDPLTLVDDGTIGRLWKAGLLRTDVFTGGPYRAYTQAHFVADQYVFALYLVPSP